MSEKDSEEKKLCPLEPKDWVIFLQNYETEERTFKTQILLAILAAFSIFLVIYTFLKESTPESYVAMFSIPFLIIFLVVYFSYEYTSKGTKIFTVFTNYIIEKILQGNLDEYQTRNVWLNRKNFFDDMRKKKLRKIDSSETEDLIRCYAEKFIDKYKDLRD